MYHLVFALFYLLSLLPMKVLYILSDFAYVLVYHVFGYRKEVVMNNLTIAFPHKSEEEKTAIAKKFYRNFTDTFIETIKFISADAAFFKRHMKCDFSMAQEIIRSGRSIQVHCGHNFNWELMNLAGAPHIPTKLLGVYLPLENKIFNRLFLYIRSRFGTRLVAATRMREEMMPHRGTQYVLGLIADQSPANPAKAYWINFFNKPTAFLKAPEQNARRNNMPVIFFHITKIKRGFYEGHLHLASENPAQLQDGELTVQYAKYLEEIMTLYPEMWLWSHRRWKKEWKPEYGEVME